jgi:Zn-dependent peptidase ImmA (M78 family)
MKWVVDTTGRFGWRPYYTREELDNECEQIAADFLVNKHGAIRFPISTDDLSVLVERDTSDLDLFADLSDDGDDVEGTTDFFPHKKPVVKIAQELSLENSRRMRLRTTLAHEYGHVRFHNFLWGLNPPQKPTTNIMKKLSSQRETISRLRKKLNPEYDREQSENVEQPGILSLINSRKTFICPRRLILQAPVSDWMEWQASYVCGALLMPFSIVRNLVQGSLSARDKSNRIQVESVQARELMTQIAGVFDVSADAARVRLQKLGIIQQIDKS